MYGYMHINRKRNERLHCTCFLFVRCWFLCPLTLLFINIFSAVSLKLNPIKPVCYITCGNYQCDIDSQRGQAHLIEKHKAYIYHVFAVLHCFLAQFAWQCVRSFASLNA